MSKTIQEPTLPSRRYHDLDALRAFAMLLGIVLHGMLSFIDEPMWPAQDIYQHDEIFGFLLHAIHGFRMPLFFLLSGFLTAMLWSRRGVRGLLKHRALRILLPLVIGVILVWPMLIGLGIWGGIKKEANARAGSQEQPIWAAARQGDEKTIDQWLAEVAEDKAHIDARDGLGMTPLMWAAMMNRTGMVERMVDSGADVNAKDSDGTTPLMTAAFLGRMDAVKLLLDAGAKLDAKDQQGSNALDAAEAEWGIVEWITGMLKLEIDEAKVKADREKTAKFLRAKGATAKGENGGNKAIQDLIGLVALGSMIPVFHHLWFLYYLLWLVVAFSGVALLTRWIGWLRFPAWLVTSRWRAAWWIPLILLPQLLMTQSFGPDTATGILPWPPKLIYYGLFYAAGALIFSKGGLELGIQRWWLWVVLAIPVLLIGLWCLEKREAGAEGFAWHFGCSLSAVIYAWLMIHGMIGCFRRYFPQENRRVRYLSDSAYWLYLSHLPVIMGFQIWVSDWEIPALPKFFFVCLVPTTILLCLYEIAVRYTFIGTMLNGRKVRLQAPTEN